MAFAAALHSASYAEDLESPKIEVLPVDLKLPVLTLILQVPLKIKLSSKVFSKVAFSKPSETKMSSMMSLTEILMII
jgi:hypothetical protein